MVNRIPMFRNYLCLAFILLGLTAAGQVKSDEAAFRLQLSKLQALVRQKNFKRILPLMHFPFYTSKATGTNGNEYPSDPVSSAEFKLYQGDIFHEEVRRLLPKLSEEALSEIDGNEETYFKALRKVTDKGSKLYEVYTEYAQPGRNSEGYFSFTFGRINGRYQIVGYYGKWPVK